MEAEPHIDADKVVDVLDRIVRERGTCPQFIRCDNRPKMTCAAPGDWGRFSRTGTAFIEPASPQENTSVESFNSRVHDELLAVEVFSCLTDVKVMVADYCRGLQPPHRPRPDDTGGCSPRAGGPPIGPRPPAPNGPSAYGLGPSGAGGSYYPEGTINHQLSEQVDG